jgi:hypothetical protein
VNLFGGFPNTLAVMLPYIVFAKSPTPPRITVLPSPRGEYAKANRGSGTTPSKSLKS